jgi:hypothetical protein
VVAAAGQLSQTAILELGMGLPFAGSIALEQPVMAIDSALIVWLADTKRTL